MTPRERLERLAESKDERVALQATIKLLEYDEGKPATAPADARPKVIMFSTPAHITKEQAKEYFRRRYPGVEDDEGRLPLDWLLDR